MTSDGQDMDCRITQMHILVTAMAKRHSQVCPTNPGGGTFQPYRSPYKAREDFERARPAIIVSDIGTMFISLGKLAQCSPPGGMISAITNPNGAEAIGKDVAPTHLRGLMMLLFRRQRICPAMAL